jgi:hypothetical protein
MGKTRRHYNLPEVIRPNLVEDIFPYDLPPLIRFQDPVVEYVDGQPVQFDFASVKDRDIVITDTTFRDGLDPGGQGGLSPRQGGRPARDGHADQLLGLSYLPQAQVPQP